MPLNVPATHSSKPVQSVEVKRRSIVATNKAMALLSSNQQRLAATLFNDATGDLYIDYGDSVSLDSFMVVIPPGGYWESPIACTEAIRGIWTVSATGKVHIREMI